MKFSAFCATVCVAALLQAEVIDRVALTIGNQAITESQIDEELRVTALLNHQSIARDQRARRSAVTRMIQQSLIKRETEVSHFPAPSAADLEAYSAQVERDFGGSERLRQALLRYVLSAETLRDHLSLQLTALRFIAFRFQPQFPASDPDFERHTDEALNVWLTEERKRFSVVYLDRSIER